MLSLRWMRNTVTYLLVVVLASLIFYGGAGVNLITYCCGDCRTEGVAVLLDDNCCEMHAHSCCDAPAETKNAHSCCDEEDDGCGIERINFDWSRFNTSVVELQPMVIDLLSFSSSLYSFTPFLNNNKYTEYEHDGPPVVCPRIYLNLLTTLLI